MARSSSPRAGGSSDGSRGRPPPFSSKDRVKSREAMRRGLPGRRSTGRTIPRTSGATEDARGRSRTEETMALVSGQDRNRQTMCLPGRVIRHASPSRWPRIQRDTAGARGPNTMSASYWLWRRQRSLMFPAVGGPSSAYGWIWWSSKKARSPHRRPSADTNAHWPPSRHHTARFTAFGM